MHCQWSNVRQLFRQRDVGQPNAGILDRLSDVSQNYIVMYDIMKKSHQFTLNYHVSQKGKFNGMERSRDRDDPTLGSPNAHLATAGDLVKKCFDAVRMSINSKSVVK